MIMYSEKTTDLYHGSLSLIVCGMGAETRPMLSADNVDRYFDVILCQLTCRPVCQHADIASRQAMPYFWLILVVGFPCRPTSE